MCYASQNVSAVIQAGGRGERLRPITDHKPKCLLTVYGVPILERLIDQISRTRIRSVTIITGWLGEQVEAYIQDNAGKFTDLELHVVRESRRLGNIGGLSEIPSGSHDLLFMFGDLVTNMDFAAILDEHCDSGADITLASHLDPYQLSFGELKVEGMRVTDYIEKPIKHTLICSGVAVLRQNAIALIPPNQPMGISDLVSRAIHEQLTVRHWQHKALWIDINNETALNNADHAVPALGS